MRFILLLLSLFVLLTACNVTTPPTYVYKADSPTLFLTVDPSSISFKPSEKGWTKQFILSFSQEDILLVDADFSSLEGSAYKNQPPFDVEECRDSVALQGSCSISIQYDDSDPAAATNGSIHLFFKYMHDKESEKLKEHVLAVSLGADVSPKLNGSEEDIVPMIDMYDFSNKEAFPIQVSAK